MKGAETRFPQEKEAQDGDEETLGAKNQLPWLVFALSGGSNDLLFLVLATWVQNLSSQFWCKLSNSGENKEDSSNLFTKRNLWMWDLKALKSDTINQKPIFHAHGFTKILCRKMRLPLKRPFCVQYFPSLEPKYYVSLKTVSKHLMSTADFGFASLIAILANLGVTCNPIQNTCAYKDIQMSSLPAQLLELGLTLNRFVQSFFSGSVLNKIREHCSWFEISRETFNMWENFSVVLSRWFDKRY